MAISDFGEYKRIVVTQLKTSLFLPDGKDTWSFFSWKYSDTDREKILKQLVDWKMNGMISLLSNTDERVPVEFFEKWGGEVKWGWITKLENYAKLFYKNNAFLIPCIFCDDGDNWKYQRASYTHQERSLSILLSVLRPFIPAVLIGLESSEYFNKADHEVFISLIKRLAPDIYVGTHLQKEPAGGMPKGLDFVAYEHSWNPTQGDSHSAEEVVREVVEATNRWGLPILPIEYNTNIGGNIAKEQAKALLRAGYGCGTPYL